MRGEPRAPAVVRARSGDWDAIEELVRAAAAPTFDAAFHVFGSNTDGTSIGGSERAGQVTEDILVALLVAVRDGVWTQEDPLGFTGRELARRARAATTPGWRLTLDAADCAMLGIEPDDPLVDALVSAEPHDLVAMFVAASLDLDPEALGAALEMTPAAARTAVNHAVERVPVEEPFDSVRDMLDARASHTRVPVGLEDRVLDRFEAL